MSQTMKWCSYSTYYFWNIYIYVKEAIIIGLDNEFAPYRCKTISQLQRVSFVPKFLGKYLIRFYQTQNFALRLNKHTILRREIAKNWSWLSFFTTTSYIAVSFIFALGAPCVASKTLQAMYCDPYHSLLNNNYKFPTFISKV